MHGDGLRGGKSHFAQAYEKGGEFKEMVDRLVDEFKDQRDHKGRDIDFALIRTKIGDAYHAMARKAKKPASKSSGKGKAKAPKPGTSKEANKSPAKKRQRGAAAYSDSDSEEEDSSQFSVEDSD